jgi:aldehyde dehydrogenase (NAD+)
MKVKNILETMDYGKAPEDPKPALEWIEKNGTKFGLYINGESNIPEGRESFETRNPATGEVLATLCQAQSEDVDLAMQSARSAQEQWEGIGRSRQGKISLCDRTPGSETFAPLRSYRNIGQW